MLDFSKASEWKIIETDFDPTALGKVQTNFCLGNGYLGLRSATEEKYLGETRDLLVARTFDRFSPEEVTELPNAADVTNIEITLNGARFDLTRGTIREYSQELNIRTGLLTHEVVWISPKGGNFRLKFERMVSLKRLHTIAARVTVIPEGDTATPSGTPKFSSCPISSSTRPRWPEAWRSTATCPSLALMPRPSITATRGRNSPGSPPGWTTARSPRSTWAPTS